MIRRSWLAVACIATFLGLFVFSGCGRSDLGQYVWGDASLVDQNADAPDTGACSAATCPTGCCDPSGTCRIGTELNACGTSGVVCSDCQAEGFDFCDGQVHACGSIQPTCNATSCPAGCCVDFQGQPACVSGVSSLACGSGGAACTDCTKSGEFCDPNSKSCVQQPCGPNNCKGCCAGSACVGIETDNQCGIGGLACTDCTQQKAFCDAQSGACVNVQPLCGPSNCANGCCLGDVCVTSELDFECGVGGNACTDCTQQKLTCQGGKCGGTTTCNANTCPGCCLTGTCFSGFVDSRCGSGGASCADCTQQSSTCDTLASPRACKSTQTTCPSAYNSCPSNVSTPVLSVAKSSCSATDLQDAKAACATGFNSTPCQQYFAGLPQVNASCAKCLAPFEYSLFDGIGLFNCVSPFVSSNCNHNTGCVSDCENSSCSQCPSSSIQQCHTQVLQGQCQSYLLNAQCIANAFFGQGSFCSPQQYGGNYGNWLAGVGAHYCGP